MTAACISARSFFAHNDSYSAAYDETLRRFLAFVAFVFAAHETKFLRWLGCARSLCRRTSIWSGGRQTNDQAIDLGTLTPSAGWCPQLCDDDVTVVGRFVCTSIVLWV